MELVSQGENAPQMLGRHRSELLLDLPKHRPARRFRPKNGGREAGTLDGGCRHEVKSAAAAVPRQGLLNKNEDVSWKNRDDFYGCAFCALFSMLCVSD
jgi:hypothetical protein